MGNNEFSRLVSDRWRLPIYLLASLAVLSGMYVVRTDLTFDDAAFYFKYVESFLHGGLWKFNLQDPPVWGASAPFWPVILATTSWLFDISPEISRIYTSYALVFAAVICIARVLDKNAGVLAVIAFAVWFSLNFRATLMASQGLETPLTYLMIGLACWAISCTRHQIAIGTIAGLLAVHKIDIAPSCVLLLGAVTLRDRRVPWLSVLISMVIAGLWYGFAYFHFGSALPNTLLTKVETSRASPLPRAWFFDSSLWIGINKYLLIVASATLVRWETHSYRSVVLFLWGLIAYLVFTFTLKVPSEPFLWYPSPVHLAVTILAALGLGNIVAFLRPRVALQKPVYAATALLVVPVIATPELKTSWIEVQFFRGFIEFFEGDRTDAGYWIAANTRPDALIATGYGGPAYYSHRYSIDWSFLNRRIDADGNRTPTNLIGKTRPDILVECPFGAGIKAGEYKYPGEGYNVVKVFDRTQQNQRGDFFCAVMLRTGSKTLLETRKP